MSTQILNALDNLQTQYGPGANIQHSVLVSALQFVGLDVDGNTGLDQVYDPIQKVVKAHPGKWDLTLIVQPEKKTRVNLKTKVQKVVTYLLSEIDPLDRGYVLHHEDLMAICKRFNIRGDLDRTVCMLADMLEEESSGDLKLLFEMHEVGVVDYEYLIVNFRNLELPRFNLNPQSNSPVKLTN